MDPPTTVAVMLALCIVLVLFVYVLGVEVGKAAKEHSDKRKKVLQSS
jgi:hypothetical protein